MTASRSTRTTSSSAGTRSRTEHAHGRKTDRQHGSSERRLRGAFSFWYIPLSASLLAAAAALAVVAGAAAQTAATGPLGPITVVPTDGPTVVLRPFRAIPLVAIRLTVPLRTPDHVEAARVLQRLVRAEVERSSAAEAAAVELAVDPTRAVYTITGPATEFEQYASLLRSGVRAPSILPRELAAARNAVRRTALADLDTPEPLLRHRLRRVLLDDDAPAGDAATATPEGLAAFWAETYRPGRMRVIVVGPVTEDAVRNAFQDWPTPDASAAPPPDAPRPTMPTPEAQALFPWVGLAYPADGIDEAPLAVAARLVREQLRTAFLRAHRAELWWASGGRRALVLLGTATPTDARAFRSSGPVPDGAGAARLDADREESRGADRSGPAPETEFSVAGQLRAALRRATTQLSSTSVVRARRALRRDILFAARTPGGLAGVLADFYGRTGEPDGAHRFLEAVDRVTVAAVRTALTDLGARSALRVEVRP